MKYQNRKYLDWLKSQPCVICGMVPSDPAHQPSRWNGTGIKSPDTYCLPLCRRCHEREHRGHTTFWGQALMEPGEHNIREVIHSICLEYFTRFLSEQK